MSKASRTKSDLNESKKLQLSKNGSYKDSKHSMNFSKLSAFDLQMVSSKLGSTSDSFNKKIDSQQLIIDTYRLLKHFYYQAESEYYQKIKKYLNGEWQIQKKTFNQHLNKLVYIQNQMQKRNYNEIQLQIVGEWRRNPVLYYVRSKWYEFILGCKFVSIGDFTTKYNLFKDFIGQLAYLYFKKFFVSLGSQKQIQKVIDKLTERTAHFIISHTTTWCKVAQKIIIPLLKLKQSIANSDITNTSLAIPELVLTTIAIDYNSEQTQMKKTIKALQQFVNEHKSLQKITKLINVRKQMELQIIQRLEHLRQSLQISETYILVRDDYVDCLVYCVIKGHIQIQKLGLSVKYFHYILGADGSNILSKFKCDPYLADLEAVYNYLVEKQRQKRERQRNNI